MKALDLYCGAGGATKGLQLAGFHVTGVDLVRSPRYCGDHFIQADATTLDAEALAEFDFLWASPPCQKHTVLKDMHNAKPHVDLIEPTRSLLAASGKPYVMENVPKAPLKGAFTLCGSMFGLGAGRAQLRRHRCFEANFFVLVPECYHEGGVIGIYGGHARDRRRGPKPEPGEPPRNVERGAADFTAADGRSAMGIDWMTGAEISQAIPPAYSLFIARAWLAQTRAACAA